MKKIIIVLLILFFSISAFAENPLASKKVRHYTHPTGGQDDCLDSWPAPENGYVAYLFGNLDGQEIFSVYVFDSGSNATESGYLNIAPDDLTAGRWKQKIPVFFFGETEPSETDGVIWFKESE
jgi:hypothetical protein